LESGFFLKFFLFYSCYLNLRYILSLSLSLSLSFSIYQSSHSNNNHEPTRHVWNVNGLSHVPALLIAKWTIISPAVEPRLLRPPFRLTMIPLICADISTIRLALTLATCASRIYQNRSLCVCIFFGYVICSYGQDCFPIYILGRPGRMNCLQELESRIYLIDRIDTKIDSRIVGLGSLVWRYDTAESSIERLIAGAERASSELCALAAS